MNRRPSKQSTSQQNNNVLAPADKNGVFRALRNIIKDEQRLFLYLQVIIFFTAFLVFANSITNGFNIDDSYYTTPGNPISGQGIKAIPKIFSEPTLHVGNIAFEYRPIAMLSFALQYELLGSSATTSHVINLLLYALICLLIFSQLYNWLGKPKLWTAFLIVLLYAVHPLHTEVVNNIKCRDELLAHLFCWVSLAYVWKWINTDRLGHLLAAILLFIFALLCKRDTIMFIFIVPLSLFFFTNKPYRKAVFAGAFFLIVFFVVPFLIRSALHLPPRNQIFIENPFAATHQSLAVRTATASYIMGWYAYLHFIPYPLSFYYGYDYVPLVSWSNIWAVVSAVIYLLLIVLLYRRFPKKNLLTFGLAFYFLSIIPFSNLLLPAPGLMSERFTFESSLGSCIAIVVALQYLARATRNVFLASKTASAIFACIFITYCSLTAVRNTKWKDAWTLYNNDMPHLARSAKANLMYSELLTEKINGFWQNYATAPETLRSTFKDSIMQLAPRQVEALLKAIEIYPYTSNTRNNLAVIYTNYDNFELAKKYMEEEMMVIPGSKKNATYHYNLGWIYENLSAQKNSNGLLDSAVTEYKNAMQIDSSIELSYWKLSGIYITRGDTASAIEILLKGASKAPSLFIELGNIYRYKGDTTMGINYYEKAADKSKAPLELLQYLQQYYHLNGNNSKASHYKSKILDISTRK